MESLREQNFNKLISCCGGWRLNSQDYIKFLGLPLDREKESARGYPKFEDSTGVVDKFYKETNQKVNSLYNDHDNLDDLRAAAFPAYEYRLEDVTCKSLSVYGPLIWKQEGNRLTRITPDYPQYLEYPVYQDFEKIRICVYHWIVHRAIKKFPSDGMKPKPNTTVYNVNVPSPTTARKSIPRTNRNISSYCEESDEEQSSGQNTHPDVELAENATFNNEASTDNEQDDNVNVRRNCDIWPDNQLNNCSRPLNRSRSAFDKVADPSPTCQVDVLGLSPVEGNDDDRSLYCGTNPAFRRQEANGHSRLSEPISSERPQKKRKVVASSLGTNRRLSQPDSVETDKANQNAQSRSGLSSTEFFFQAPLATAAVEEVALNFPPTSDVQGNNAMRDSSNTSSNIVSSRDEQSASGSDHDSVLDESEIIHKNGGPHQSKIPVPSPPAQDTQLPQRRRSKIVKLKVNSKANSRDCSETTPMKESPMQQTAPLPLPPSRASRRLRRALISVMEEGHQDIKTLQEALENITHVIEENAEALKRDFGDDFGEHQITLYRWLEYITAFIQFRQLSEFNGNKDHWKAFFDSLSPERKRIARSAFIIASDSVHDWRDDSDFSIEKVSNDLGRVLFSITIWKGMMDLDYMQKLCAQFNEGFLTWFD